MTTLRLNGYRDEIPLLDRCVLDGIGRILDSSEQRQEFIKAINRFSAISLMQTRSPLKVGSCSSARLSPDELALLDAASCQLMGRSKEARTRLQWLMEPRPSRHFLQSINTLANAACFKAHGVHALAPRPFDICTEDDKADVRHKSVLPCADLSEKELLIVNATRLWVKCIALRINSLAALQRLSSGLGLEGIDTTLHDILHRTAYHAIRQFDVRCLCCSEVSPDEARLLASLAAITHGRPGESVEHLNHWLPPTSVQGVLASVSDNRKKLLEHRHSLPLRKWDFTGLLQRQILFEHDRTGPAAHSKVH